MREHLPTRRLLNSIEQAKIAGERDRLEGYPCSPAFREGTEEYTQYMEGYYDSYQLYPSTRTH